MKHDPIDPGSCAATAAFARPQNNAFSPLRDRDEAGRLLAERLRGRLVVPAVVAAIPRGGVAVALPIVQLLRLPLTVIYARKLTAPVASELAFGALDEDGVETIDAETVAGLKLRPADVAHSKRRVAAEIKRRMALYQVPPLAHYLPNAHVVLVDDGLATGLTMWAAVAYARRHGAREITLAVPCASAQSAEAFRSEVDHVVSLVVDSEFTAVGAYYVDFSPVPDDAVLTMLERAKQYVPAAGPSRSALRVLSKSSRGHRLAGDLFLPDGPGLHPVVVFAHGWGSSKASPASRAVAEALRTSGLASFLFDFTGHGASEGRREESTLTQQVGDLRDVLKVLQTIDDIDACRVGIVGEGSTGAAVLQFAAGDSRVRALVLRSANLSGAEDVAYRIGVPTLLLADDQDMAIRAGNEEPLSRLAGPLEVVPDPGAPGRATELTIDWMRKHLA